MESRIAQETNKVKGEVVLQTLQNDELVQKVYEALKEMQQVSQSVKALDFVSSDEFEGY